MKHKKIILFLLVFLALFSLSPASSSVVLHAEEKTEDKTEDKTDEKTEEDDSNHATMDEDIALDRNAKIKTSDFITSALYSLDPDTAEKEKKEDYIKYFMNSSATAVAYGISLADPETIIIWMLKFVITFVEIVGIGLTLIVMLIYNLAASDLLGQVINSVFDGINSVLFDWGDGNSYIYKILFLLGILMIIKKMIDRRKNISVKQFISIIVSTVASCMFVVFIGMYGRPVLNDLNTQLQASMVTTFSFGEEGDVNTPIEIQNKRLLFENLQMKAFRLRHFGVTETDQIAPPDPNGYKDGYVLGQLALQQWEEGVLTAQQRVDALLENPGVDEAKKERQTFGSSQIAFSAAQSFQILTLSVVFIIHRIFLAIIFGTCCILVLITSVMATLMIAVITYRAMAALLGGGKAQMYAILNCLQWMLLATIANVLFSALLFAVSHIVALISSFGIILLIPVDALLFIGGKVLIKRLPAMVERLKESLIGEDGNIAGTFKGVLTGDTSVSDLYDNYRRTGKGNDANEEDESTTEDDNTSINDIDESEDLYKDGEYEEVNDDEKETETSSEESEDEEAIDDSSLEDALTGKQEKEVVANDGSNTLTDDPDMTQEESSIQDVEEKGIDDEIAFENTLTDKQGKEEGNVSNTSINDSDMEHEKSSVQDIEDNEQYEEDLGYEITNDLLPEEPENENKKATDMISMSDIEDDEEQIKKEMDMLEKQEDLDEELKVLDEETD